jgi:hypothetical protein
VSFFALLCLGKTFTTACVQYRSVFWNIVIGGERTRSVVVGWQGLGMIIIEYEHILYRYDGTVHERSGGWGGLRWSYDGRTVSLNLTKHSQRATLRSIYSTHGPRRSYISLYCISIPRTWQTTRHDFAVGYKVDRPRLPCRSSRRIRELPPIRFGRANAPTWISGE